MITGLEETIGEKGAATMLIAAGRARGKKLAQELGLTNSSVSLDEAARRMRQALGKDGTKLCKIDKIVQDGEVIKVYTLETLCSADKVQGSPRSCTFTLGAICGALEQLTGKRLEGKHTESVLRGSNYDVLEFKPKWGTMSKT